MFTDKMLEFVINSVRYEEKVKQQKLDEQLAQDLSVPRALSAFWANRKAADLIEPANKKAKHHREREQYWIKELEEREKKLREKGVSVEVFDSQTQTYMNYGHLASGVIGSGSVGGSSQNFQPRVDPIMLDSVKNAKAKMLDHRSKAEQAEKYARAFAFNPEFTLQLSVDQIDYFKLEN